MKLLLSQRRQLFAGAACLLTCFSLSTTAVAENIKQNVAAGTTTDLSHLPKGYDHPMEYMVKPAKPVHKNAEPSMQYLHVSQLSQAKKKLAAMEKKTGKKPNLFIFLIDDSGWMDWGFNGGGVSVGNATPKTDAYANDGLVLTSAYSQPSCSPTRTTINTGQLPIHHGVLRPPMYGQPGGLGASKVKLAQVLSNAGYVTQGIGKWHMGENVESQPQNSGYDDYYGFLGVSDEYTEWLDPYFNYEVVYSPDRKKYMEKLNVNYYNIHGVKGKGMSNTYRINLKTIQNLDQDWKNYGLKFIDKMANSDKPFFLYYNTRGCHFDNYPNDNYKGKSVGRTTYSDCIVEMDDIFGSLMDKLKATKQLDNTLVLFMSDNGPEAEVDPRGRSPFRGFKGSTWEGGMRVPTFAYWKGMIAPGRNDGLFDYSDLFPTFLSLAGVDFDKAIPKDYYVDGIDQTSFLLDDDHYSNRRSVLYWYLNNFSGVRIDNFKAYNIQTDLRAVENNQGAIGGFSGGDVHLSYGRVYNVTNDPQEMYNIGVRHLWFSNITQSEFMRYAGVLKVFPPSPILVGMVTTGKKAKQKQQIKDIE